MKKKLLGLLYFILQYPLCIAFNVLHLAHLIPFNEGRASRKQVEENFPNKPFFLPLANCYNSTSIHIIRSLVSLKRKISFLLVGGLVLFCKTISLLLSFLTVHKSVGALCFQKCVQTRPKLMHHKKVREAIVRTEFHSVRDQSRLRLLFLYFNRCGELAFSVLQVVSRRVAHISKPKVDQIEPTFF